MDAKVANFLEFLSTRQQLIIPIYQRTYSWTREQCQQLWQDIIRVGRDDIMSTHFVGSVVYIRSGSDIATSVSQRLLIDGQQRVTTISLLISEFGKALEARGQETMEKVGTSRRKLTNFYLVNDEEEEWGGLRYKLLLTQKDKDTLIREVSSTEASPQASLRIIDNARFFREQLTLSTVDLAMVYHGLKKLMVVEVSLEYGKDNPQLIFESLNSTGLDLSQADLIRNYVLMGLAPNEQASLYNGHWHPMEESFGEIYAKEFDYFIRDYLTIKNGRIPNIRDIYTEFKVYIAEGRTIADVVADVHHYAKFYVKLNIKGKETDSQIQEAMSSLWALTVDVANPFLMEVYDDYEMQRLTKSDFVAILRLIESYVFRRQICGIPTNSLNKTFANLSREMDKEHYLESTQVALLVKDSYRRFPSDEEFCRELRVKDVYNFRTRSYLLDKLENYGRKEKADIAHYTIEHILPQNENLRPEWQADLGPEWKAIQSRYLHTLGNLTLTGYNSEYSDRPFLEKRDMTDKDGHNIGFVGSPLRMNEGLGALDRWNEDEILRRSEKLMSACVKVWVYPQLSNVVITRYAKVDVSDGMVTYTLSDHAEYLNGAMLDLFEQFRRRAQALDASVQEKFNKLYISYKTGGNNFVDVVPQKSHLRLTLNMNFEDVSDPLNLCKGVTGAGHWGNGNVEISLATADQLDNVMALVKQTFIKYCDDLQVSKV